MWKLLPVVVPPRFHRLSPPHLVMVFQMWDTSAAQPLRPPCANRPRMDSTVVEPPSRQLLDLLSQFGLASARDLRRCRPLVRRLARDLPTFDSVWIDALTQTRTLTPFQARLLESDNPQRLQVGPCILVDEWERDGRWTLCLAKHRATGRRCLLTYVNIPADNLSRARDAVRDLIAGLRGLSHPSLIVPQGCDVLSGHLVVVNPYFSGPTLQQLLVRRGRFPIPVVTEIARQILDALAALEQIGVVHGDLSLVSIRLTSQGQTILPNPGVLPTAGSLVTFHNPLPPAAYDGTAPELISTGRTATFASDLYALGCLLWQLLAGRPPFPTGDPLSKLAAHQSRAIDDVRRWRPDTPDALATIIARVTQKDPELRPSGPQEIKQTLRLGSNSGRGALARFHASFGVVAPRHSDSHRSAARFPLAGGGLAVVPVEWYVAVTARCRSPQRAAATGRPVERTGTNQRDGYTTSPGGRFPLQRNHVACASGETGRRSDRTRCGRTLRGNPHRIGSPADDSIRGGN